MPMQSPQPRAMALCGLRMIRIKDPAASGESRVDVCCPGDDGREHGQDRMGRGSNRQRRTLSNAVSGERWTRRSQQATQYSVPLLPSSLAVVFHHLLGNVLLVAKRRSAAGTTIRAAAPAPPTCPVGVVWTRAAPPIAGDGLLDDRLSDLRIAL